MLIGFFLTHFLVFANWTFLCVFLDFAFSDLESVICCDLGYLESLAF